MSGSYNKVILVGNVGADPEIRHTQAGQKIASLSVATSERWKDKNTGQQKEKTEWHKVQIFSEPLVRVCESYVKKGSRVLVEGQLQTRKWQDQSGADKYSTEVVLQTFNSAMTLLDGPSGDSQPRPSERQPARSGGPAFNPGGIDDDIPFHAEFR